MAKLSDLKALLDTVARDAPVAEPITPARSTRATKHGDGDIDLSTAFADVTRLPAGNRVAPARARPAPHPRSRIEDEREALELSKYGAEPAPHPRAPRDHVAVRGRRCGRGVARGALVRVEI